MISPGRQAALPCVSEFAVRTAKPSSGQRGILCPLEGFYFLCSGESEAGIAYVPDCQLFMYSIISGVSVSSLTPVAASFRLAISLSTSSGST